MQTNERFQIEVMFWDEEFGWDEVWASTTKTYTSRTTAAKAAERVEVKNAANGVACKTRIVAYPVGDK